MDPEDISSLFFGDEDQGQAHAQALAQALRGQQQLGLLGAMSGDKVLGNVGNHLLAQVQQQQELIPKAANMRLQRAMEAEKAKRDQTFQQAQMAHMTESDRLDRTRLAQDAFGAVSPSQSGPGGMFNKKTGAFTPFTPGAGASDGLSKDDEKEFLKFADTISTTRGRGSLQKDNQDRLNSAARLEAMLLGPNGDLINATPQQVREAGTALASLIAKGAMSEHQISELTPSTLAGQWANLKQKVLNEPQGADAQGFLQNMLETAAREKSVVMKQMRDGQAQGIPAFARLRGKDKGRFDSILKANGFDPEAVDDSGLVKEAKKAAAAAPAGPNHASAMEWAKANPNDPRAARILQANGGAK